MLSKLVKIHRTVMKDKWKIFFSNKNIFPLLCPPYLIILCKEHLQAGNMHHTFSTPGTFSSTILSPVIYSDHYKDQEENLIRKPPATSIYLKLLLPLFPKQSEINTKPQFPVYTGRARIY